MWAKIICQIPKPSINKRECPAWEHRRIIEIECTLSSSAIKFWLRYKFYIWFNWWHILLQCFFFKVFSWSWSIRRHKWYKLSLIKYQRGITYFCKIWQWGQGGRQSCCKGLPCLIEWPTESNSQTTSEFFFVIVPCSKSQSLRLTIINIAFHMCGQRYDLNKGWETKQLTVQAGISMM